MLKKSLSVFLSMLLLMLCFFSVPVFAAEPVFDIRDYTIEDLQDMTVEEKKELMAKFIDAYNPYGIKELMEQAETASNAENLKPGVETQWKSDSDSSEEGQQMATHQVITLEALAAYIEEFGFYNIDATTAFVVALYLAAASGLPDVDEKNLGFAGHFYDPDIGCGINIFYKNAKDNVIEHYDAAYQTLRVNPYMLTDSETFFTVLEELGRALHYIQDVCEPHHAANIIAGVSTHMTFESYVDGLLDNFLPDSIHLTTNAYLNAKAKTAGELAHSAAILGKSQLYNVIHSNPDANWDEAATKCVRYAVENSTLLIYKLFADCNVV